MNILNKVPAMAALAAGALLLVALINTIVTGLQPANGWLSLFGNNWLVILFKLHAGVSGVQISQLYAFSLLDITIMALVATLFLGLYAALSKTSRIWSLIALAQPFLGMAIFIVTGSAGRSAVMGAVLVISLVMLRNDIFGKAIAYTGIMASVFLLVGDLSVDIARSGAIAILIGAGYMLLTAWLILAAQRLFWLERGSSTEGVCPCH